MKTCSGLITVLLISASCSAGKEQPFLEIRDDAIVSAHALPFELANPEGFNTSEPVTHFPDFNGHPFKVSLAGYFRTDEAILVHAEQVLDDSGVLDYRDLPRDTLSGQVFGVRSQCAEFKPDEISDEHDLNYIQSNGFRLLPAAYLRQYLMSSDDFNFEYIVSYAVSVESCSIPDSDPDWNTRINERVKALVQLKSM